MSDITDRYADCSAAAAQELARLINSQQCGSGHVPLPQRWEREPVRPCGQLCEPTHAKIQKRMDAPAGVQTASSQVWQVVAREAAWRRIDPGPHATDRIVY